MRKYRFNWDLIGNIEESRPNLGNYISLDTYRLMQCTLRDILEEKIGADEADKVFYEAGKLAGREFYEHCIQPVETFEDFVSKTQRLLKEKGIGILRMEETDIKEGKILLTVDEDSDCSGLPIMDYETCIYDEGFLASLFECYTQKAWKAKEIDCWCTGARTCRFVVTYDSE